LKAKIQENSLKKTPVKEESVKEEVPKETKEAGKTKKKEDES